MIEAVIYDLDNTIFPASSIMNETAQSVTEAIEKSNSGTLSPQTLAEALADCYKLSIWDVARKYHFTSEMLSAARAALSNVSIDYKLFPYDDYPIITELTGLRFLVTSGHIDFQLNKIKNLGIAGDFSEICVHDDNEKSFLGKKKIFQNLQDKYKLKSRNTVVVGDNPSSEIEAGNLLNMITVQVLRAGVIKTAVADYHVNDFFELKSLFQLLNNK